MLAFVLAVPRSNPNSTGADGAVVDADEDGCDALARAAALEDPVEVLVDVLELLADAGLVGVARAAAAVGGAGLERLSALRVLAGRSSRRMT